MERSEDRFRPAASLSHHQHSEKKTSRSHSFSRSPYSSSPTSSSSGRQSIVVPPCFLVGAHCRTYLLEKSRVVSRAQGERSYHIFHQILSAPMKEKAKIWKGLLLSTSSSAELGEGEMTPIFNYVVAPGDDRDHGDSNSSYKYNNDDDNNDDIDYQKGWSATVMALEAFGIGPDSDMFLNLMRALCIVLQLGNLGFSEIKNDEDHKNVGIDSRLRAAVDGEEGSIVSTVEELNSLSNLMGIPVDEIKKAMTCQTKVIRKEEVVRRIMPGNAKDNCDALAKEIYARIFDVLVRKINEKTSVEGANDVTVSDPLSNKTYGSISLLDIFGFERFDINRFEQLCINYANERLQQRYVKDNFLQVMEEYTAEGIKIFDFALVDNSAVLDLLEGPRSGLIDALNEECMRPKGTYQAFVYNAKRIHSNSRKMLIDRLHRPYEFGILHFAGAVTYDATKFVQSNTDLIPPDLLECASRSTNPLIREEFRELVLSAKQGGRLMPLRSNAVSKRTVLAKFREQLGFLMEAIDSTRTRYIRCIRPNREGIPRVTDHREVINQLESAGLVTAITVSRENFPNRLNYEVTWDRFHCLLPYENMKVLQGTLRHEVDNLLATLLTEPFTRADGATVTAYECGKTKVYFRIGALERLETRRMIYYSKNIVVIQKWYRSQRDSWNFLLFRQTIIIIQARSRGYFAWKSFKKKKSASILLQAKYRGHVEHKPFHQLKRNVIFLQATYRGTTKYEVFRQMREMTLKIQCWYRCIFSKKILIYNINNRAARIIQAG